MKGMLMMGAPVFSFLFILMGREDTDGLEKLICLKVNTLNRTEADTSETVAPVFQQ